MKPKIPVEESVLDAPKATLDPAVWQETPGSGKPVLAVEAQQKLDKALEWVQGQYNFSNLSVFLIGSICSNSWSENSDIDIDFCAPGATEDDTDEDVVKEFGWAFKKNFIENYMEKNPEDAKIGTHPLEVYFNPNPFQCFMSIGCYNVLEKKWEVGPELKSEGFDPISEYYADAMKQVDRILKDTRTKIFEVYELAFVSKKSSDQKFKDDTFKDIFEKLDDISELYKTMKRVRSNFQKPCKSKEEALKRRKDKKQLVVDAAFKFLDKFGYVQIMKDFVQLYDDKKAGAKLSQSYIVSQILASVKENMSLKHLQDSEDQEFIKKLEEVDQLLNESLGKTVSLAAVISLLAVPSILPRDALAADLKNIPVSEMHVNSDAVKKIIKKNTVAQSYNGLNATNIINVVARTIYAEARSEGTAGLDAVASVIWNRAGGKPENFVPVISKKSQFSCWRSYTGGWTDKDFKFKIPDFQIFRKTSQRKVWDYCVHLATLMYNGDFKSTIGNRNMIGNKKLDNKDAWDSWGKDCDLKIGNHAFGYEACHDGFAKKGKAKKTSSKPVVVVVKSGDTLGKIAKAHNTTVDKLLAANKDISDPNKIKIGQKIQIA